ncbi:MAG: hypothetical protein JO252_17030, partial [Planctomycetaceae bacterium]|nr:hypothetical protein [Planctomycetaceae bacterium]
MGRSRRQAGRGGRGESVLPHAPGRDDVDLTEPGGDGDFRRETVVPRRLARADLRVVRPPGRGGFLRRDRRFFLDLERLVSLGAGQRPITAAIHPTRRNVRRPGLLGLGDLARGVRLRRAGRRDPFARRRWFALSRFVAPTRFLDGRDTLHAHRSDRGGVFLAGGQRPLRAAGVTARFATRRLGSRDLDDVLSLDDLIRGIRLRRAGRCGLLDRRGWIALGRFDRGRPIDSTRPLDGRDILRDHRSDREVIILAGDQQPIMTTTFHDRFLAMRLKVRGLGDLIRDIRLHRVRRRDLFDRRGRVRSGRFIASARLLEGRDILCDHRGVIGRGERGRRVRPGRSRPLDAFGRARRLRLRERREFWLRDGLDRGRLDPRLQRAEVVGDRGVELRQALGRRRDRHLGAVRFSLD